MSNIQRYLNLRNLAEIPEIAESTAQLRETLARKRAAKKAEEEAKKAVNAIMTHVEGTSSEEASQVPDKIISPVRSGAKFATAVASFLPEDEQVRKEIVENIVYQENNWDTLKGSEMGVSAEEINMWNNFLNSAKNTDFIGQSSVAELKLGETVHLDVTGFSSFQLVKIRTREKDGNALCMVRATRKNSAESQASIFFVTLPLNEGGYFSMTGEGTKGKPKLFPVKKIFLNTKQGFYFR